MKTIVITLSIVIGAILLDSCASATKVIPPNTIVLKGRMNPVTGSKALKTEQCWAMEVGSDITKLKYYQFIGEKDLLEKIYEEDAVVTVRALPRPDSITSCPVGTVMEIFEVVEMRSKKD